MGVCEGEPMMGTVSPPHVTVPSCHTLSACRDLSWNTIRSIHPKAFSTLRSLVKL